MKTLRRIHRSLTRHLPLLILLMAATPALSAEPYLAPLPTTAGQSSEGYTDTTVKKKKIWSIYAGAHYTVIAIPSWGIVAGVNIKGFDIEGNYSFGTSKSKELWFTPKDDPYTLYGKGTFKQNSFGIKAGYEIQLGKMFALTPQIGFQQQTLKASLNTEAAITDNPMNKIDGAKNNCLTVGLRATFAPVSFLKIMVTPELYGISLGDDAIFRKISENTDIKLQGFNLRFGLLFSI